MELHKHGKIWAESEGEGFGCTFIVQLPLYSLHYVPPTGYSKRGSLELSLLSSPSTNSSESPHNASCVSVTSNTTNGNGNNRSEHESAKEKQLSVSTDDGSEYNDDDGTIIKRSKGRNSTAVPPLVASSPQEVKVGTDVWKPIVLVIDDSKMNRKMMVRMLNSKGFDCREAEDGMEGLSEMTRLNVPSTMIANTTRMSFNMFSGTLLSYSFFTLHSRYHFI